MANSISPAGLTVATIQEIIDQLTAGMQAIYGADINVASNSPDGQLINLFAQASADMLELLVDVYNSFTVQSAYGVLLDQRVAINGITRRQGTYTVTQVSITVNQALTLTGLDALTADPTAVVFTVADGSGNQFYLETTTVFSAAGTQSLAFRAVTIGQVQTTPNTITNQVTSVLGVTNVNNPLAATLTGVNEETDAQLKVRQGQSFALASTGPADAVEAALAAVADITDALVVENDTGGTVNGVPAHSIWCIVAGGTAAEIGQAIYAKKGPGCGMKGSTSHVVTRPNGTTFTAQWDAALTQPLYIKFNIIWRGGVALDDATIIAALAAALSYKLNQPASVGDIVTAMAVIAPTAIVDLTGNQGVSSDGITYQSIVSPTTPQYAFTVAAGNITIS